MHYAKCVICGRVIGPLDSTPFLSERGTVNARELGWARIEGRWHCREHNPDCTTMQISLWEIVPAPPRKVEPSHFVLTGEWGGMKIYTLRGSHDESRLDVRTA